MPAAVLFDLGGVLLRLDYAAIAERAAEQGIVLEPALLARAEPAARHAIDARSRGEGCVQGTDATRLPDYLDDLLEAAGLAAEPRAALVPRLRAEHRARNLWRVPVDGAHETLAALQRAGLRTGVVSNSDGRAEALLRGAGLAPYLDVIVDSHWEGVEKPDPEIFRRALVRLGVPAPQAVYVGDIWSIDVVGSRSAGLRPILLDGLGGYADAVCERIRGLAELPARIGLGGET